MSTVRNAGRLASRRQDERFMNETGQRAEPSRQEGRTQAGTSR